MGCYCNLPHMSLEDFLWPDVELSEFHSDSLQIGFVDTRHRAVGISYYFGIGTIFNRQRAFCVGPEHVVQ